MLFLFIKAHTLHENIKAHISINNKEQNPQITLKIP